MSDENMRVLVTKRMLREGLFRCLQKENIEKISVSELCRESHINRATFYNHYETPKDILVEMGWESAGLMKKIYDDNYKLPIKERFTKCIELIYSNKESLKILYSCSADKHLMEMATTLFAWAWTEIGDIKNLLNLKDELEESLVIESLAWASYFMLRKWVQEDIDKSPAEMADMIATILGLGQ